MRLATFLLCGSVIFSGCSRSHAPLADAWVGKWTGPEGTWLDIEGGNGSYKVTIKDLDAARSFEGSSVSDGIEFQRNGVEEVISATDGNATGMKWLAGKKNCLTVKAGEGYCRD
jgi:hypothetical protein